jgi:glycosyltransferase involved in cell wall biosynthesis
MKISIIIPTFNSSETIQDTINSVISQNFKNYEIIIVDNNSKDKTIEIIQKNRLIDIKFIIENDNGIYDAINKGIKLSTGKIISLLHSDDIYYDNKVLDNVVNAFIAYKTKIVYGDLLYVKKNNIDSVLRFWKSKSFVNGSFLKGWHPPHSSFFVQKELFNKYGFYKTTIGNSADVELMYRFLEINNIYSTYINYIFVKMRYGGKSNKTFSAIFRQNIEIIRFLEINKSYYKILFFFMHKLINRLKQFFVRP